MNKEISVFIPVRLCILGEHSDWAAGYRKVNKSIEKGYAIVVGLNLGIYLKGSYSDRFTYRYRDKTISLSCDEVLNYTKKDFFQYVVSSARIMMQKYGVLGINIFCEKMTLPIKKGLSSSAAICISVIRMYNIAYNLKLSMDEEFSLAYEAELATGSKCGKMDQICIYGKGTYKCCFDGDLVSIFPLNVRKKISILLVDLNSSKNTKKILSDLNKAYPFASNKLDKKLHFALGVSNKDFVRKAERTMKKGNVKQLGRILYNYQKSFDNNVANYSSELTAPILHKFILEICNFKGILSCKGVGSQGDGMVQLLLKDSCKIDSLVNNIKRWGYTCYKVKIE